MRENKQKKALASLHKAKHKERNGIIHCSPLLRLKITTLPSATPAKIFMFTVLREIKQTHQLWERDSFCYCALVLRISEIVSLIPNVFFARLMTMREKQNIASVAGIQKED